MTNAIVWQKIMLFTSMLSSQDAPNAAVFSHIHYVRMYVTRLTREYNINQSHLQVSLKVHYKQLCVHGPSMAAAVVVVIDSES